MAEAAEAPDQPKRKAEGEPDDGSEPKKAKPLVPYDSDDSDSEPEERKKPKKYKNKDPVALARDFKLAQAVIRDFTFQAKCTEALDRLFKENKLCYGCFRSECECDASSDDESYAAKSPLEKKVSDQESTIDELRSVIGLLSGLLGDLNYSSGDLDDYLKRKGYCPECYSGECSCEKSESDDE